MSKDVGVVPYAVIAYVPVKKLWKKSKQKEKRKRREWRSSQLCVQERKEKREREVKKEIDIPTV